MPSTASRALQRYYPQIYLACHVDHVRTKSNAHHISAHDAALLAHLDDDVPTRTGTLARHLGVAASTLSAAIKRLEALGHVRREPRANDRRQVDLWLTAKGAEALGDTSVLDTGRLKAVLARLSPAERKRIVAAFARLAGAARAYQAAAPRRKRW